MNWPFWLELIVRSSWPLLAGEALRRLSKAQSAAFRHKLLLWALLMMALLPVLSIVLPAIPIPAWTQAGPHQSAVVTAQEVSSAVLDVPAQHRVSWPVLIWVIGVLLTALPVFIGAVSVWRIARRAEPFGCGLPTPGAEVFLSGELFAPLTCGLWRPRILLPAAARDWSAARLNAVLLHELAHVRRRDVAVQIIAHLIAALWWFQPLVWILRRSLRAESELACDAEALQSGFRPSAYATELLAIAKAVGRDARLSSCGISMASGSNLENRVHAILRPGVSSLSRAKVFGIATALASIGVAASAVTLRPDPVSSEQGGSIMKRTLISGLLTSVGLSAATVGGSVHDASGAAVANAAVIVLNPDTGAKQETATDAEGKFSVDGASAGQYILRVEKPGFASIFREFDLRAESKMERRFTMTSEGDRSLALADEAADDGSSETHVHKLIHVGGEVAQNNLTKKVQPEYPTAAKTAGTQGTVEIEATISKDGVPVELRVVRTPSSDLAESSLEAVRQWRYRPTLLNGELVEIVTTIIVNYTLAP